MGRGPWRPFSRARDTAAVVMLTPRHCRLPSTLRLMLAAAYYPLQSCTLFIYLFIRITSHKRELMFVADEGVHLIERGQ